MGRQKGKNGVGLGIGMIFIWSLAAVVLFIGAGEFFHANGTNREAMLGKVYLESALPFVSEAVSYASTQAVVEAEANIQEGSVGKDDIKVISSKVIDQEGNVSESAAQSAVATAEPNPEPVSSPQPVTGVSKDVGSVLIYHTHATESYQPVFVGNFHSIDEVGTVRQVGDVLEKGLGDRGIKVIHDKTLHDSPSYNYSYNKSLETAKNHLAADNNIKTVIDLHRDAAAYQGGKSATVNVNGKQAATFSIVIGTKNPNVAELRAFANKIMDTANAMYPGIGRKVIEREHRFNGYLSNQYVLLEVGNNENTIDETLVTGAAFAEILAKVLDQ